MCQANTAAEWKTGITTMIFFFCSLNVGVKSRAVFIYKTFLIHHDQVWNCGSSRMYEPDLFPVITEQQDSNLWCNVIVMITCDIIVQSGKSIIAVNIKVLKRKCYLIVCHYYNGKYFSSVMYLKWLHPVRSFFHAIFEQPQT